MVWYGVVWCGLSVWSHQAQSLAPGFSSIVGHTPAQCGTPEHCETHFGKILGCITTLWHMPARPCSHKHIFWHNYRITFMVNLFFFKDMNRKAIMYHPSFLAPVFIVSQILSQILQFWPTFFFKTYFIKNCIDQFWGGFQNWSLTSWLQKVLRLKC